MIRTHVQHYHDKPRTGKHRAQAPKSGNKSITKIINDKEKQRMRQIPAVLPHNRKKAQKYREPELDSEDDERVKAENAEKLNSATKPPKSYIDWSVPFGAIKPAVLWFEKEINLPLDDCSISSPMQRTRMLQDRIAEKDKEMRLLRTQLFKSQEENMKLVRELKQCSGQRYDDVVKENRALKGQAERLIKQTTRLLGHSIREKNHIIQKQKQERHLLLKNAC